MRIENHILKMDDDREYELPRLPRPARVHVWQVPENYRTSGLFVSVQQPGDMQEQPACSPFDAIFLGTLDLDADDTAALEHVKSEWLQRILHQSDAAMAALAGSYSAHEKLSWDKQEAEARAYLADSSSPTPLLSGIAAARNLTVEDLAQRVLAKVAAYEVAAGQILGEQQRCEDSIKKATSIEAVQTVAFGA
ncbi:hypothetical protein [Desulfobotulus sp.]|uniref:hypothetical protein n=1 Tax=Desulfobotulus sp. TaxID=1940337 RepID=UPI002A35BA08|nr:hypothetical protein [Desulfobotulus sp.]MDY0164507.1 hypothetical protein [Desulfobotulus sp.]